MHTARLFCLLTVLIAMPAASFGSVVSPAGDDAYLRGYVESWLVHHLGLDPWQVAIEVHGGVVTLTGAVASREIIDRIVASVASFPYVVRVINRLAVGAPRETVVRWPTWLDWARPAPGRRTVRFPTGDLFAPPMADQKQPRFHTTLQRYRTEFGQFDIASVGFGENFGLVRWPRESEGDGWQLGISGAVFAIFDLDSASNDLLNADYIVGFPLIYRSGVWSARLRLFHQSSHLGDEFLLRPPVGAPVERINLSYEAIEILGSWERDGYRIYGGGSHILSTSTTLGRNRGQLGLEYRGSPLGWRTARVIAGLDVQAWNETAWDRDWSLKAGLLFRGPYGDARSLQVLLEYYDGHAPHGQFFQLDLEYFGAGVAYSF